MRTILIAEVGLNANGSVELAKKLIDVAVRNRVHYVKFQKRDINLVYSKEELDAPRESPWGKTNREQKEGLEFSLDEYCEIDEYCAYKGVEWFASPWDINSITFLEQFDFVPFLKVPSALITDEVFLKRCRDSNFPVILSTGMSTDAMVENAVKILGDKILAILACTSTYPSQPNELNLNNIKMLKKQYPNVCIGFSNHSPSIIFMPVAVALGADMVEFHITLDRSMYGSDQPASIEPGGVEHLVKYIEGIEKALGDGYKVIMPSEISIIEKLRKV